MSKITEVCVDASLAVKWVVREALRVEALGLLHQWTSQGVQLVAPSFFLVEVDSILRRKATLVRKPATDPEISPEDAEGAFEGMGRLDVKLLTIPGQRERAWEMAKEFDLPVVYDATYMALAELRGCEFWTADDRLAGHLSGRFPLLRRLADFVP